MLEIGFGTVINWRHYPANLHHIDIVEPDVALNTLAARARGSASRPRTGRRTAIFGTRSRARRFWCPLATTFNSGAKVHRRRMPPRSADQIFDRASRPTNRDRRLCGRIRARHHPHRRLVHAGSREESRSLTTTAARAAVVHGPIMNAASTIAAARVTPKLFRNLIKTKVRRSLSVRTQRTGRLIAEQHLLVRGIRTNVCE